LHCTQTIGRSERLLRPFFVMHGSSQEKVSPRSRQHVEPIHAVVQSVKPEFRLLLGLLTQLPPQFGNFQRQCHARLHLRISGRGVASAVCRRTLHGTFTVQAVLLTSCGNMFSAEALRSTGVTRRPHYYGPLRLPTGPPAGYVFPTHVAPTAHPAVELPDWASQVPRLICRCPPSSTTPGSPTAARAHCFTIDIRLRHLWKVGRSRFASRGRNRFTHVTADIFAKVRLHQAGHPNPAPTRLHGERANTMTGSFQPTRPNRLNLTHQRSRR